MGVNLGRNHLRSRSVSIDLTQIYVSFLDSALKIEIKRQADSGFKFEIRCRMNWVSKYNFKIIKWQKFEVKWILKYQFYQAMQALKTYFYFYYVDELILYPNLHVGIYQDPDPDPKVPTAIGLDLNRELNFSQIQKLLPHPFLI